MKSGLVTVLLAGDHETSDMLQKWFIPHGCECQVAESFAAACRSLSQTDFDIVLCQYDLPDRTALPLLDWLEGTQSTLLFYASSGKNSRWLPVIDRGQRCMDRPSIRAQDLPNALNQLLETAGQVPSPHSVGPTTVQEVPRADLVTSGSR